MDCFVLHSFQTKTYKILKWFYLDTSSQLTMVTMSVRIWTIRSSHKANKSAGGVAALTYRSHWIVHCNEKFFYRDVGWYTNMTQAFPFFAILFP